jgi:hypothetical protein
MAEQMVPNWATKMSEWMGKNLNPPQQNQPTPWSGPTGIDVIGEWLSKLGGGKDVSAREGSPSQAQGGYTPNETEMLAAQQVQALMQERGVDVNTALQMWNAGERPAGIMGVQ